MPNPTSDASHVRQVQILCAAICFSSPIACVIVFLVVLLESDPNRFFVGFDGIAWHDPKLLALMVPAVLTTAMGVAVHQQIVPIGRHQTPAQAFRLRHLLAAAGFEATALFGLAAGFVVGPTIASLALICFAVPAAAGAMIIPREHATIA